MCTVKSANSTKYYNVSPFIFFTDCHNPKVMSNISVNDYFSYSVTISGTYTVVPSNQFVTSMQCFVTIAHKEIYTYTTIPRRKTNFLRLEKMTHNFD